MKRISGQKKVELVPGGNLRVTSDLFSVKFKPSADNIVTVDARFEFPRNEEADPIEFDDLVSISDFEQEIRVDVSLPRGSYHRVESDIQVEVPGGTVLTVELENGAMALEDLTGTFQLGTENGGIRMERMSGGMKVRTENGGIRIVRAVGDLEVECQNGGCRLLECRGEILDVRNENGSVKVQDSDFGEVEIINQNGKIEYGFVPRESGSYRFLDENGKIVLVLPEGVEFDLTARNDNGRIRVGLPNCQTTNITRREGKKEVHLVVGSGKQKIEAENDNGPIVLVDSLDGGAEVIDVERHVRQGINTATRVIEKLQHRFRNMDDGSLREKIHGWQERMHRFHGQNVANLGDLGDLGRDISREVGSLGKEIAVIVRAELDELRDLGCTMTVDRVGPVEPVEPVDPVDPVEPVDPMEPGSPDEAGKAEKNSQSRLKVLKLLEEGKITVDDAHRLLSALQ